MWQVHVGFCQVISSVAVGSYQVEVFQWQAVQVSHLLYPVAGQAEVCELCQPGHTTDLSDLVA